MGASIFLFRTGPQKCQGRPWCEGEQTDLDQVVDDYDTIPNIGLNNPEEGGALHAQELAQGACSCREELGPVAPDPDLADDIACPGRANQLQITRTKIIRRIAQAFKRL